MNILPIQPRHNIIPLDGWQLYRRDGEQFLRTAVSAHQRGNPRFTPEIVYNLVAMAIEKLIMALLMRRATSPTTTPWSTCWPPSSAISDRCRA